MKLFSLSQFLLIPIFLITTISLDAQRTCSTHEHMDHLMQDHDYAVAHQERMERFEAYHAENQSRSACPNPVILPMAVHYQGLSNYNEACLIEMAERQIQILNDDYGGTNADITNWTNNAANSFPGISNGETCVQFCLATQNHPTGFGVTEGQPAVTFNVTNGDSNNAWAGYVNIFVFNTGSGILGYSPLGGSGNGDGVAINYFAFSNNPGCGQVSPQAPYNGGRTLTHELGHYLNLDHMWGNGGCNSDDGVSDTPNSQQDYGGCPNIGASSCGSIDMHMNYMDYVNDACMYMFSAGQSTRMENYVASNLQHVVNNYASACVFVPAAPIADFNASTSEGCAPFSVTFSDNSGNLPTSWSWSFPGGTPSSHTGQTPPAITYSTPGTYTVTLDVTNAQGSNSSTFSVSAIDCSNIECEELNHLTGITPTLVDNPDGAGYISGHNSYNDIAKAEFFDDYGANTLIDGVEFDFGQASGNGNLEFVIWSANGGSPAAEIASQMIPISTIAADVAADANTIVDFGGAVSITGNFFVGFKLDVTNGSNIAVNSSSADELSPNTAWEQWSSDNAWYPFNDGTNNTWGFDISLAIYPNVCSTSVPVNDIQGISNIRTFPNPAFDEFQIEMESDRALDIEMDIFDGLGRRVLSGGTLNVNGKAKKAFDISQFAHGTYFLRMTSKEGTKTVKFLKI